jgi:hypothetical protein
MSDNQGGSAGASRSLRTYEQLVQDPEHTALVVEQAPVLYDGNLPSRRFVDGVEVAPDGTESQLIISGDDETGGFVESRGYRFSISDLALAGGEGRNSVLAPEAPRPLESMGRFEPSDADHAGATVWVHKIGEIARDLKIPEATTVVLARRMLDTYSELRAAQEERDRLEAGATNAQLEPGALETIETNLRALFPDGFGEEIIKARKADGSRLINDPAYVQHLLSIEVTGGDEEQDEAVDESEYDELTKLMGTDIGEFMSGRWRGGTQTPSDRMLEIDRQRRGETA